MIYESTISVFCILIFSYLLILTFSGTSLASPLTEALCNRPIRGPDDWYRSSPTKCSVLSGIWLAIFNATETKLRTSCSNDSSVVLEGVIFKNLQQKEKKKLNVKILWSKITKERVKGWGGQDIVFVNTHNLRKQFSYKSFKVGSFLELINKFKICCTNFRLTLNNIWCNHFYAETFPSILK